MANLDWILGDAEERLAYVREKFDKGEKLSQEEVGFLLDHIDGKHKAPRSRPKDGTEKSRAAIQKRLAAMIMLYELKKGDAREKTAKGLVAARFNVSTRTIENWLSELMARRRRK